MSKYVLRSVVCLACLWTAFAAGGEEPLRLENGRLGLSFDRKTGTLVSIHNKLTGETYQVSGDEFSVEATDFRLNLTDAKLTSLNRQNDTVKAVYRCEPLVVEVAYALRGENHFAEKHLTLTSNRNYGLKHLVIARPQFSAPDLTVVRYEHIKNATYFGRTPQGGFFTGVEKPFDTSSVKENRVTLAYAPSLKVAAGEKLECEPVYFGVYRKGAADRPAHLPRRSESDAMVAMTTVLLDPPKPGLRPMAIGYHSEMVHDGYTEQSVAGDMKSLDFLAECGIDWVSTGPWGGEIAKMNSLVDDQPYQLGPLVRKFLEHARKRNIKVFMCATMNKTHPWSGLGKPFRPDKSEWLMDAGAAGPPAGAPNWRKGVKGNCIANRPFYDWLERINAQGLATGYYAGWVIDGDFFGGGGVIAPVDCQSSLHDHLAGDSNYACERALMRWFAGVRAAYPDVYVWSCAPPYTTGVWLCKHQHATFPRFCAMIARGLTQRPGTSEVQPLNVVNGNEIRTGSRTRVHREFFPHYMDLPLLFPNRDIDLKNPFPWPSEKIDYVMLSGLSCAPGQLYLLPTKTGIPERDKAEIRKWLDWGRKNIDYLMVRKDLPDWPASGKVDGSAHIVGNRGLVFLFNPSKQPLEGKFVLSEEEIGLVGQGRFRVAQQYPVSQEQRIVDHGAEVRWPVPAEAALILEIQPAK